MLCFKNKLFQKSSLKALGFWNLTSDFFTSKPSKGLPGCLLVETGFPVLLA
jgi:hypothetical protein